jgi:predicted alpha/beta-fold hydrolase
VPALVITSEDDPFVPCQPFRDPRIARNPYIELEISAHGGHCGFVGAAAGEDDGYWAEERIVDFVAKLATAKDAEDAEKSSAQRPLRPQR